MRQMKSASASHDDVQSTTLPREGKWSEANLCRAQPAARYSLRQNLARIPE